MATAGQKYGISGQIGAWTFGGNWKMPINTLNNESAVQAIVAGTTRTQAGATALLNEISRVDTSTAPAAGTSLGDGVVLPVAASGFELWIWNNTGNNIQLYGAASDSVNGVAAATGIIMPPAAVYACVASGTGSWAVDGVGAGASGNFPTVTAQDGLVAKVGGGQSAGTAMQSQINRYITVTSAADSGTLPVAKAGMQIVVTNAAAANSMNVFPGTGDAINALGANAAYALAAGKTAQFNSAANGQWHAVLGV